MKNFEHFDLLVIGGGASGLGVALDAATRGLRTLLVERDDFGKGTSSRSTKLIHGGVRYLRNGQVSLVRESLRERGRLLANAPGIVTPLTIVLPTETRWQYVMMRFGLWLYDRLAGKRNLDRSRRVSPDELRALLPTLRNERFRGAVAYTDGQFDDAGLIFALLATFQNHGGTARNYTEVTALLHDGDLNDDTDNSSGPRRLRGARLRDTETGIESEVTATHVVNATGPFADTLRRLDDPTAAARIVPSRGSHLVLPARFLPGDNAILIPETPDGRIMFVIPWQGVVLAGTTDHRVDAPMAEPTVPAAEVDEILATLAPYLTTPPTRADILSQFAGLRPLVATKGTDTTSADATASLSRSHVIETSASGLVSLMGGKWTTYRQMAEDTVDRFTDTPCKTHDLRLADRVPFDPASPESLLHAVREEHARTLEDLLARRCRLLFRDAREAMEIGQSLVRELASAREKDEDWAQRQRETFEQFAKSYHDNECPAPETIKPR